MKTQINIKNGTFLILSILFATATWAKGTITEENYYFAESTSPINYGEHFSNALESVEALLLSNIDSDESTADVSYELESSSNVELNIFDGPRFIMTLVEEFQNVGTHTVRWDTSTLPPGEYTVVLVTDNGTLAEERIIKQVSISGISN